MTVADPWRVGHRCGFVRLGLEDRSRWGVAKNRLDFTIEEFVDNVQYLNLEEMRTVCKTYDLALHVHLERADGTRRKTGDRDRKDVVLNRIVHFATTGERTGPTIYAASVVGDGPLPGPITARTRIRYGQYDKTDPDFIGTLRDLTGGAFRSGMIARLVLRDFWTAGVAPTMKQFADQWIKATAEHTRPRPEGAYLSDRWKGEAGADWTEKRIRIAANALDQLEELVAQSGW